MQVNLEFHSNYNRFFNQGKQALHRLQQHFAVVPLKRQQSTNELINKLEAAINLAEPVAVQMNFGFDQENIADFYGVLSQTLDGRLLLEDADTKQLHQLMPALVRNISFTK
ncbi:hypothetical protein [Fructobacillus ficulneus]|uniref:Uncharacterized protein n=1 Tax=Fructobacillus ficulneus TaxID=157463 RepID=A0A0K8MHR2_9LACO|nr:hypothetical protein [Fructobacillus ficulneus]GAO99733.1 hypothetical protein FFIC_240060 [Fructobacillus ficulneus]